ncbi:MBOAT, membrane-bound O-acyltransferase family-domain-containing protein [Schizothecium vesticola]|uniref:MBOAT, membrane-bound O-acyltransferase family-domain-containing protein n=1 Tax=Schizothecium vesticola TaxID=314040 RepID=A0AA40BQ68_9PEZI|nr:MBOAT, membrane-bound O-acyltransferase family-domain-containing protein [Schizothecium vesticola]
MWDGLRTILISSAGAYAIAKFLRGSPYMGWVGFVFLMGHLSINQIARMRAPDPHAVDITGAQMVLVMKLSSFCWNVADGAIPEADLSDSQRDRRLTELPGLLDFLGYVFFFPSLFAGPAFDFAEYRRWLDLSMFDVPATVDPAKKPPTRRKRKIPRSGTPAMKKLAVGLLWIFIYVQLSAHFYPEVLTEPTYKQHGFLQRVLTLHMVPLTARTKYYGVWTLTEGACILAGLGYNGVDPSTGQVSWDRLVNIHPLNLELAQNTRAYLENWNVNTNRWLRNCVYLRVTPKGKKPGFRASMATFTTSAIWHGFYPGYYMSFILASLVQTVAKNFRRYFRPFFLHPRTQAPLPAKPYYDAFSWLVTQFTFSFATVPFLVLSLHGSLAAWANLYFYAVIGTLASLVFFASPAKPALKRKLEERAAEEGERGEGLHKSRSVESLNGTEPVYGMPGDAERDWDEAVGEIRAGVKARKGGFGKGKGVKGMKG